MNNRVAAAVYKDSVHTCLSRRMPHTQLSLPWWKVRGWLLNPKESLGFRLHFPSLPGSTVPRSQGSRDTGPSACILFKPSDFPHQLEVSPAAGPALSTPAQGSTCRPSDAISATVSCHLIVPELATTLEKWALSGCLGETEQKIATALFWGKKE